MIQVLNLLSLGYFYLNEQGSGTKIIFIIAIVFNGFSLTYFLVNIRRIVFHLSLQVAFIVLAIFWILIGNYLFFIFLFAFAIIVKYAGKELKVVFKKDHIEYPSFPVNYIEWKELSNVVLKDRVLTIDLKNNKLIQHVLSNEPRNFIDQEVFNRFCIEQLKANDIEV